jgi:hypothetical protein
MRALTWPLRLLKALLTWLLALVVLFEEWGWEPLSRLLGWIAKLPVLAWLERRIAALPPYAALPVFLLPGLMLLPVKLLALWAMSHGHVGLGLAVIVGAKLAGTAIVARLFILTRPQLMKLGWFARLHDRWVAWKEQLLAQVRASWPWRAGRVLKARLKRRAQRLWQRLRGSASAE